MYEALIVSWDVILNSYCFKYIYCSEHGCETTLCFLISLVCTFGFKIKRVAFWNFWM